MTKVALKKSKIYWIAIISIIAITLVNQAVIQFILQKKKASTHVVNMAGRQRMLSQKIVKLAYQGILVDSVNIVEMKLLCEEWNRVHAGLQFGNEELGLPVLENDEISRLFRKSNPYQHQLYEIISKAENKESIRQQLAAISWNEEHFLPIMEEIVLALERKYIPFQNLILVELILAIIALVIQVFEIVFIFTPLFERLQKQNKHLTDIAFDQSHRIRAPVCSILGLIGLIDKNNMNEANNEIMTLMEKSASNLREITSEIVVKANLE